jgi:Domain of unknown function (DUF4293)
VAQNVRLFLPPIQIRFFKNFFESFYSKKTKNRGLQPLKPSFINCKLKKMLQRIQTIWLALAGACLMTLFFVPNDFIKIMSQTGEQTATFYQNLAAPIMLGIAVVATFGSIFLFQIRPQQIKIARLALLDVLLFFVVCGLLFFKTLQEMGTAKLAFGWAVGLPIAAAGFLFLALRAIRADENLVESTNRLR